VLSASGLHNTSLPILDRLSRFRWIRRTRERSVAREYFDRLRVRTPSLDASVAGLSGGNQQKIVLAKWLAANSQILILDEPTRGVDVGAKAEIHALVGELAARGTAILVISSELPRSDQPLGPDRRAAKRSGGGRDPAPEATEDSVLPPDGGHRRRGQRGCAHSRVSAGLTGREDASAAARVVTNPT
jgi:hypothetical protein